MNRRNGYGAVKEERFSHGERCPMCGSAEEELNCLLIHCKAV